MCTEKTDDKNNKSANNCCNGMEEMMKSWFAKFEEAGDCCTQMKEKCSSGADNHTNCMTTMFQRMQDMSCGQAKSGKGPGCCT